MALRTIGYPGNICVKEGKVAISFLRLHGELNVQVIRAVPQPVGSMLPGDKNVIHIMEPAEGLMSIPVERHLLEILHEGVGGDRR
jgi:hypothetical protein